MKLYKLIPICLIGVVGCSTTGPETDKTPPPPTKSTNDVVWVGWPKSQYPLVVSDKNFSFYVDANGIPNFKRNNPNATLDDLYSFVKVRCLNERLYSKMDKGDPISKDEALLLKFAMDAQATMIRAVGIAMVWDIYGNGEKYATRRTTNADLANDNIEEFTKRETKIFAPLIDDYVNGNGLLREKIRAYGRNFQVMDPAIKVALLENIFEKGKLFKNIEDTPTVKNVLDSRTLLTRAGLITFDQQTGDIVYPSIMKNMEKLFQPDYQEAASKMSVESSIGQEWLNLNEMTKVYLMEYWKTYNTIKNYSITSKFKGDEGVVACDNAMRICQESVSVVNMTLNDYCIQFYDFPFVILTMNARAEFRKCKGWNDDEDAMKEVMMKYGEAISGTDMLSHLNSTYAIDAYADFLEEFKSDIDFMGDSNFKRFQAVTRIREFAREKTVKDLNTGLETNKFKDSND